MLRSSRPATPSVASSDLAGGRRRGGCPSSSGSGVGELEPAVRAARLLAGEREAGDQAGERIGVLEQRARSSSRAAPRAGEPPDRVAGLGRGRLEAPVRRARAAASGSGSASAAAAARAPRTKHSVRLFEASRLAPWRPVQAHSPTANRPGSERAALEVGGDAAHHVVGGGRDRDRLGGRVDARPRAGPRRRSGSAPRSDPRRSSSTWSVPSCSIWSRIARVTASRGASSSVKRSPRGVEQRRALAADRLGDQQAVRLGARRGERGRVELAELEVGELGAGGVGHHRRRRRSRPRGWSSGPRARRRRRSRGPSRGARTALRRR